MATANDGEDLETCGVCLCEYDEVNRTPKFLPCSHTACLLCLKVNLFGKFYRQKFILLFVLFELIQEIGRVIWITCPFCNETFVKFNVESLPNNPYAIHKLKLRKELPKPTEDVTNPL